ncbi:MAG TPA: hypothetical protein ENN00_01330, partial [Bacillaceae bacterium]|nr:hypothetical protein [Bacillaceae bacterium]
MRLQLNFGSDLGLRTETPADISERAKGGSRSKSKTVLGMPQRFWARKFFDRWERCFRQAHERTEGKRVRAYLERLVRRNSLTPEEARAALSAVVEGEATPVQAAALLTALRVKGEDVEEVLGFVETLRAYARPFPSFPGAVDTAGTGGDGG